MSKIASQNKNRSFTDHPRKQIIRKEWSKPFLEFINQNLNKKLIYLGLPGAEALDIKEWLEYLDKVIAFQCDDYKGSTDEFKQLYDILNSYDIKGLLKFVLYKGYIEDVVIRKEDADLTPFVLEEFITVYNLDFCNTLHSPQKIINSNGDVFSYYKSEVVNELLKIQSAFGNENGRFIMFLTVNSEFLESTAEDIEDEYFINYINELKNKKSEVRRVRILKAYTFHLLNQIAKINNFKLEFLPPIFYQGTQYPNHKKGGKGEFHWMMTFTVLGTTISNAGIKNFSQEPKSFLQSKFAFASDTGIRCFSDPAIEENDFNPNIDHLIKNSYTYNNFWN